MTTDQIVIKLLPLEHFGPIQHEVQICSERCDLVIAGSIVTSEMLKCVIKFASDCDKTYFLFLVFLMNPNLPDTMNFIPFGTKRY